MNLINYFNKNIDNINEDDAYYFLKICIKHDIYYDIYAHKFANIFDQLEHTVYKYKSVKWFNVIFDYYEYSYNLTNELIELFKQGELDMKKLIKENSDLLIPTKVDFPDDLDDLIKRNINISYNIYFEFRKSSKHILYGLYFNNELLEYVTSDMFPILFKKVVDMDFVKYINEKFKLTQKDFELLAKKNYYLIWKNIDWFMKRFKLFDGIKICSATNFPLIIKNNILINEKSFIHEIPIEFLTQMRLPKVIHCKNRYIIPAYNETTKFLINSGVKFIFNDIEEVDFKILLLLAAVQDYMIDLSNVSPFWYKNQRLKGYEVFCIRYGYKGLF
jgi:hypothetical protein